MGEEAALFRLRRRSPRLGPLALAVLTFECFGFSRDIGPVVVTDGRAFDFGKNAGELFQAGYQRASAVVD